MKQTLKKLSIGCAMLGVAFGAVAADNTLLAFPGAEGFGRFTQGARAVAAPEVYHVTTLADSGAGSFRDAVSKEGRIIVFDVSGVIKLKSALVVKGKNTILGQTAPGEGVQVYGDRVSFSGATNLIVRHMRFRMGASGTSGADACGVANGTDMIFDHLSVLWGLDENFSVSWDNKNSRPANITIQNSIIGQGLQSHSCGGLIQTIGGVTLYRNLYIENKTRNPKVKGLNQFVNNVVYNWGNGGCYIMSDSEGDSWADIENNYFVKGPWNNSTDPFVRGIKTFRYYGAGNYYDSDKDGVLNGHLMTEEEMRGAQSGTAPYSTLFPSLDALNANITEYNQTATEQIQLIPEIAGKMTAEEAYAWMLTSVGPVLPARDDVDQYLIDELASYGKTGTKNGISTESQLSHKGTGTISGGVKPLDSDGDGMPDAWETANGLNPNDASDALAVAANGYLNIENYANSIVEAYPYIKKPIKLVAGTPTKTTLKLTWDINKNTEHGFVIELSTDGKTFAEVASVSAGAAEYELADLTPETNYWVRLRATDGKGLYSDYTDTIAFATIGDPSAPKPSVNPFPADGSKEGIANGLKLTWENNINTYGGDVTYTVMLGESKDALASVATGLKKTEWDATSSVEAGKTYYWRVDATNTLGTTPSDVWSFSTTAGGVLFYADFHTLPASWGEKYANITTNTNVFNAANTTAEFDGMIIGSGSNAIRAIAMNGANNSADMTKDYGPATAEDAGASDRCLQFYTTKAGGYIESPEVQGPCVITLYLGNPDKSSKTVKLVTIAGGKEESQDLVLGASKRIYKFTSTYTNAGAVKFRLDANGKKFNVNDLLIERYIAPEGEQALELTSGSLENDVVYTDGSISLSFNQEVKYNGGATIDGNHQFENITVGASGSKLSIAYEALDANSTYTVSFPAGALTNVAGDKSFIGDVKINTSDFPREKEAGETHWGKAAVNLPLNFAPFNETAPFETAGSLVQTKQNDYPHWCQVGGGDNAGEIAADHVTFRSSSSNDKVMAYFGEEAKQIHLEVEATEGTTVRLKIQETRNADIAPTWRTIRILTEKDLPFNGELDLNPASRFVKITPSSIAGAVSLKAFRISDASGNFGDDFSGILDIEADSNAPVEYFNLQGIRVDNPTPGLYIRRQGTKTEKVIVK